jgi:hypothetical protein
VPLLVQVQAGVVALSLNQTASWYQILLVCGGGSTSKAGMTNINSLEAVTSLKHISKATPIINP